jgi:hypothetical protein
MDFEQWTALDLASLLIRVIQFSADVAKNLRVLVFYTWTRYADGALLSLDYIAAEIESFASLRVPCIPFAHSWLRLKDVTRHGVILQWLYTSSALSDAEQYAKLMDVLLQNQYTDIQCVSHALMPPDLAIFQSTDDGIPALLQYKAVFNQAQKGKSMCGILLKTPRISVLICALTFFDKVFIFL